MRPTREQARAAYEERGTYRAAADALEIPVGSFWALLNPREHRRRARETGRRLRAEGRHWNQRPENALAVELSQDRYERKRLLRRINDRIEG